MSGSVLNIEQSLNGPVCVVAVEGRIDSSNAMDFMLALNDALSSGGTSIVVDLRSVLYLTSAAFRVLLVATDEAQRRSAQLALCNVVGEVRELFEISGLLRAFTVLGSREEAVAQLS
jgi:anti-anti-sigma factor